MKLQFLFRFDRPLFRSAADQVPARGENTGPLHGLPIAHKDLVPTKDMRTTFGSRIYEDFVPDHGGLIVQRLKKTGAITIGATNTPVFGAGSQTFNQVFNDRIKKG
jgi:amidase